MDWSVEFPSGSEKRWMLIGRSFHAPSQLLSLSVKAKQSHVLNIKYQIAPTTPKCYPMACSLESLFVELIPRDNGDLTSGRKHAAAKRSLSLVWTHWKASSTGDEPLAAAHSVIAEVSLKAWPLNTVSQTQIININNSCPQWWNSKCSLKINRRRFLFVCGVRGKNRRNRRSDWPRLKLWLTLFCMSGKGLVF